MDGSVTSMSSTQDNVGLTLVVFGPEAVDESPLISGKVYSLSRPGSSNRPRDFPMDPRDRKTCAYSSCLQDLQRANALPGYLSPARSIQLLEELRSRTGYLGLRKSLPWGIGALATSYH